MIHCTTAELFDSVIVIVIHKNGFPGDFPWYFQGPDCTLPRLLKAAFAKSRPDFLFYIEVWVGETGTWMRLED